MMLALSLFGLISLVEVMIWTSWLWSVRKYLSGLVIVSLALISGYLFGVHASLWTALIVYVTLFRVINLLKLIENRITGDHLYFSTQRTSLTLILSQLSVILVAYINSQFLTSQHYWLYVIGGLQLIAAVIVVLSTLRHIKHSRSREIIKATSDRDLPTMTVAIPARNETDDLKLCLQSLIESDYPKLEIIVLDDCSQLRKTPETIRGFAQSGVKFVAGEAPPDHWLAKNYAYKQLVEASSGEYILFCGVDSRFDRNSLRLLVEGMIERHKNMISVIPINRIPETHRSESLILQTNRYAWELALPRKLVNRPAILSTCWLIKHDLLHQFGGFDAIAGSISPESYFARQAIKHDDSYAFIASSSFEAVYSHKQLYEQRQTAIRTRYPQLHRQPEVTAVVALSEIVFLILPLILVAISLFSSDWTLLLVSLVSYLLQTYAYSVIAGLTYRKYQFRSWWLFPVAAVYDVYMLLYSMWQYEFGSVVWKDRNICLPLMQYVDYR